MAELSQGTNTGHTRATPRPWDIAKVISPYLETIAMVLLLATIQFLAAGALQDKPRYTLLLVATCYATWRGGTGPAIVALIGSGLVGALFFRSENEAFTLSNAGDVVRLILTGIVGIAIILFGGALRAQKRRILEREEELRIANAELADAKAKLESLVERRTEELKEIRRFVADEV
jgi:K+-sensing histidine kinase KdpD